MGSHALPGVPKLMFDRERQIGYRWTDEGKDDQPKAHNSRAQDHPINGYGPGVVANKFLEAIHLRTPTKIVHKAHRLSQPSREIAAKLQQIYGRIGDVKSQAC
ncbi:MAG: hypothetical protein ACK47S_16480 [Paracoccaceae bacterium]|jgi:hypothetical protein